MMFSPKLFVLSLSTAAGLVFAESHTIKWTNNCSYNVKPVVCSNSISGYCWNGGFFMGKGRTITYTHQGPLVSFISYGHGNGITCNTNGEGCLITEGTLQNLSSCKGCNSVDLSLIPPHAFNVGNSFQLSDGAGGHGCESSNCATAFHVDGNDGKYQKQSNGQNIGLNIIYCAGTGNF